MLPVTCLLSQKGRERGVQMETWPQAIGPKRGEKGEPLSRLVERGTGWWLKGQL